MGAEFDSAEPQCHLGSPEFWLFPGAGHHRLRARGPDFLLPAPQSCLLLN